MLYLLAGMTLSGFIYYYRDLLAYNAMYYYTCIVESIKPYYYSPGQITDSVISFYYLDFINDKYTLEREKFTSNNAFCVLKLNENFEKYSPVSLNDITKEFNEYRNTGKNVVIEKIKQGRSEILTASVTITSNGEPLPPFDCTSIFHKLYFPGNKLVLTNDTKLSMIKLLEYEYDTKFPINYDDFNIQYIIITMNSKFYMSSSLLLSISPENDLRIVNKEDEN